MNSEWAEEREKFLKVQQAFNVATRFYKGMAATMRDETSRRMAEQAWGVLEQHFQEFKVYLQEKDDRKRRRELLVSLVQSTQAQLQNIQGLL